MENIENACSEMDFILTNLSDDFTNKIPENVKKYFKNNKSKKYNVNIDCTKPLFEQELLEETKIFIQIVFKLFISSKYEKDKYITESRKMFVKKSSENWIENNKKIV